ncbi:probable peroxisomal membrane protein PEX13 [Gigantopelta aegis]|uniref:probable peroxisomal membrane protein PEX13 n=1 Tax=Gigantopelta aegis TaxID=1735272 RepID=UPI001B88D833|nr:probable peroxisomal membrane protein PEX13 [Gigantopelta aegis]
MAAPLKPWERAGVNSQNQGNIPVNSMSGTPLCEDSVACGLPQASAGPPPPLPLRQSDQTNRFASGYGGGYGYSPYGSSPYGSTSSYGSTYGSYGGMYSSPYSSYGGYGGFGSYGYNSRYGNDQMSTFVRQAEESSRPAFQSIESIVHAFTSVGMMLDSSFQAVYNSFRAVLGVADNFSRLKTQMLSVFSALAVIRTLRYIYRKILELLRLRPAGYASAAWQEAAAAAATSATSLPGEPKPKNSAWPIMMFFGIILGAPWLIWKLIRSLSDGDADIAGWASTDEDHFVARAKFDFQTDRQNEITFVTGETIIIAPKELQPAIKGWLLASVDGKKTGLVPANYVKVLGKRRGRKYEVQASPDSSLVQTDSAVSLSGPTAESSTTSLLGGNRSVIASVSEDQLSSAFQQSTSSADELTPSDILDKCQDKATSFTIEKES